MGVILMKHHAFLNSKPFIEIWITVFISLLSISLIQAVPPVTTNQQFTEGFDIKIPQDNILKEGQDYDFEFHVENITNGYPITSGVSCIFHLYNSSGKHQYEANSSVFSHSLDIGFFVSGTNFSISDRYYYNIQCNNSLFGGQKYSILEVNPSGRTIETPHTILYMSFLGLLILVFFLNFYGMSFLPAGNQKDEEGKLMSITYLKYFRNVLWMTGYFLFIGIMYISSNLAFYFLLEELVAKTLFMIFRVSLLFSPVVVIIWIIWMLASMFHDKEMQKMLNRGMFPGGNV